MTMIFTRPVGKATPWKVGIGDGVGGCGVGEFVGVGLGPNVALGSGVCAIGMKGVRVAVAFGSEVRMRFATLNVVELASSTPNKEGNAQAADRKITANIMKGRNFLMAISVF
jgi:hypothetical protein